MLLLLESTTSCAKVLAWLPDAPPNLVPFGKVMVCGFCSSGCCTTSCCGGGCAHAQNTAVIITIVITENNFFLIKPPRFSFFDCAVVRLSPEPSTAEATEPATKSAKATAPPT